MGGRHLHPNHLSGTRRRVGTDQTVVVNVDDGVLRWWLRHREATVLQRGLVQRLVVVTQVLYLRQARGAAADAAAAAAQWAVACVGDGCGSRLTEVPGGNFMVDVLKVVKQLLTQLRQKGKLSLLLLLLLWLLLCSC